MPPRFSLNTDLTLGVNAKTTTYFKDVMNRYGVLCRKGLGFKHKNGATINRNRVYMNQMKWMIFYFIFCVPIMFSAYSQWVPHDVPQVLNVSLKGVPNSTHFISYCFAQSSRVLTNIGEPKGRYSGLT